MQSQSTVNYFGWKLFKLCKTSQAVLWYITHNAWGPINRYFTTEYMYEAINYIVTLRDRTNKRYIFLAHNLADIRVVWYRIYTKQGAKPKKVANLRLLRSNCWNVRRIWDDSFARLWNVNQPGLASLSRTRKDPSPPSVFRILSASARDVRPYHQLGERYIVSL